MPELAERTLVDAVVAAIGTTGFDVGDGRAPDAPSFPYSVVYSVGDLDRTGPNRDTNADVVVEIQVTSVGQTREQAQGLGDLVRSTLVPGALSVSGRKIVWVDPSHEGVERDDDVQPPLFYSIDTLSIGVTPG